jgi:hypothetical protein
LFWHGEIAISEPRSINIAVYNNIGKYDEMQYRENHGDAMPGSAIQDRRVNRA